METIQPPNQSANSEESPSPNRANDISHLSKEVASFIAARTELASIEAKEAAEYAAKKLAQTIILAICAFFTWSLFLASLTGILAPIATRWLDGKIDGLSGWAAVLLILAILHGLGVIIFLGQVKKKPSSPLFELSRKEIEHDKQWLKKNK